MIGCKSMTTILAAAAGLATPHLATAQTDSALNWNNAAGGAASTTTNWAPNQMPAAADDLTFNLLANYTVTFSNLVPSAHTHTYKRGQVTLSLSSPHTVSAGLIIGDLNTDLATATLTTGTLNSGGPVTIGNAAGSNGTLAVNDVDADFIMTGTTSDMIVGSNAPGSLLITGGGLVQVADQLIAGNNAAGTSTVTVSGVPSGVPVVRSRLNVLGTGVSSKLGQGGDATVSISNGALATFAGDVVVSNGSASTSVVTLGGVGGILSAHATLDVTGELSLGRNTNVGTAAGVATLTVNSGADVLVGGVLHVGDDPDGGTGTLNINAGALVEAASVIDGSLGTINHTGGTLRINGGTYTGIPVPLSVSGLVANDVTLVFANSAAQTLVPAGGISLIVGNDLGAGTFEGFLVVESGAHLDMGNGDLNIGDDTGVTGTVTINGAGSRLIATGTSSDVRAGFNGTGNLNVEAGGQLLSKNLLVPGLSNATGTVNCTGAGSNITTQFLAIGQASGTGSGELDVQLGATLNVTDPGFSTNIRATGILAIAPDCTMTTPGTITVESGGLFSVHGAVTGATLVDVNAGSLHSGLNASGTPLVDAPVHLGTGAALEALVDDFTVGDAASVTGFVGDLDSTITIGTFQLTLLDADEAVVDTVTIAGGTLAAPNGISINNNGSIDGTGTITTSELFFNSGGGVVTATGASGITINGKLRNNSGSIDGTVFTFNGPDGGWTGAGAINAKAVFNSGTEVNALANMTIGDGSTAGVTFNLGSELHADTRTVTLLDSNGLGLPSVTDMSGGHIVCAQPLVVNNGRRLSGRGGSVDCPTLTINGRLSPGELVGVPAGETGELTINASLVLQVNANTDIEVGGPLGPIEYDRVVVNGTATLNGDLNISFINGYVPSQQDRIEIIRVTSVVGQFAHVNLVGQIPANTHVAYYPDKVRIEFCYANCDQSTTPPILNVLDFGCFLNRFSAGDTYANCDNSPEEFPLNVLDFACFLNSYAAGCQ